MNEVLHADVNYVVACVNEHQRAQDELLERIFGKPEGREPARAVDARGEPIKLTPKIFDAMFGGKKPRRPH